MSALLAVIALLAQDLGGAFYDHVGTPLSESFTRKFLEIPEPFPTDPVPRVLPIAVCKDDCVRGVLTVIEETDGEVRYRISMSQSIADLHIVLPDLSGACVREQLEECASTARAAYQAQVSASHRARP